MSARARHAVALSSALLCSLLPPLALGAPPAHGGGCPRYQGKACAGHGVCQEVAGGAQCSCEAGYSRSDCSWADLCPGDCSGQGTCLQPAPAVKRLDPLKLGTCVCNAGFGGDSCTRLVGRADQASLAATVTYGAAPAGCASSSVNLAGTEGARTNCGLIE